MIPSLSNDSNIVAHIFGLRFMEQLLDQLKKADCRLGYEYMQILLHKFPKLTQVHLMSSSNNDI